MEIRKKSDATFFQNTPTCGVYEYGMGSSKIDSALIELSGRYPQEGWALNTICTSVVHIVSGEGRVIFSDGEKPLVEDMQILIPPHEPYVLEGNLKLIFSASPAWSPEQARNIK